MDTDFGGFRPRHLTTDINFVYHLPPNSNCDIITPKRSLESPEFHSPLYSNVTHLCLLARPGSYTSLYCAGLSNLPKLTHLAVEVFKPSRRTPLYGTQVLRPHISRILSDCKLLELLLIQVDHVDVLNEYYETTHTIKTLKDPRVVVIIKRLPTRRNTGEAIQKVWPYAEAHAKVRKWGDLRTSICEVSHAIPSLSSTLGPFTLYQLPI